MNVPALRDFGGLPDLDVQSFPLELIPPESREAVLGWMLGTLHAGQSEILRRQDDLQRSVALILQHIKNDSDARHDTQRDKLETLAIELARLDAKTQAVSEIAQPSTSPQQMTGQFSPEPQRPARNLPPAPEINPTRSLETAAWLLERIDKAGHENKFSFRSFMARRGAEKPASPPTDNASNQLSDLKPSLDDHTNKP